MLIFCTFPNNKTVRTFSTKHFFTESSDLKTPLNFISKSPDACFAILSEKSMYMVRFAIVIEQIITFFLKHPDNTLKTVK